MYNLPKSGEKGEIKRERERERERESFVQAVECKHEGRK
jgi:hypothetical protein